MTTNESFRAHAALTILREIVAAGPKIEEKHREPGETDAQVIAWWSIELADALIEGLNK